MGLVSIVLEDNNILGYVGTVEGSVYIDFAQTTARSDTAGRFTFSIKRSPIDDSHTRARRLLF